MKKFILKYSYLFLLYPFLVLTIVVNYNTDKSFAPERVIFLYLILYFLAFFITNKTFKSLYVGFIYICSLILTFFEVGYVSLYKERITPSTAFILLETNTNEVKEYLNEYFDFDIILLLFIMIIPSLFILKGTNKLIKQTTFKQVLLDMWGDIKSILDNKILLDIKKFIEKIYSNKLKKIVLGVVIIIAAISIYIKDNHHKYNALYQLYEGYENYLEEVKKYKVFADSDLDNDIFSSLKSLNSKEEKETYIIVIGESSTRNHFGVYNYYRNTTPELNKIKNELVIFKDVISPHTHTIPALEKVLTFGDRENPDFKFKGSIVQLMKKAGFKTYWISNQVPIGVNETLVALIAKKSDYIHFTNLGGAKELRTQDVRLLPYFENVLKDSENKKFIVVHLLGTHTQYENRYPKEYDIFKEIPPTPFPSEKSYSTINEYDNAVLYNDFVLSEIIKKTKSQLKKDEKTFILYFSDHGEDVYETVDFTGHSEVIGSRPMFEIPFIYWSNDKSKIDKFSKYVNRKYMTDDLIYSIADLTNLSFNGDDKTKSIFNDTLQPRERIIKNNIDYDNYFK